MRKFMFMVGAVALAVSVQAASILWGGAVSQPDGETEIGAGTMAYLVWSDSAFSSTGATFDGTALKVGDVTLASMVDSHAITASESGNWDFAGAYSKAGSDVDGFYAVLISNGADNPMYSFYDLGEVSGTTPTSPQKNLQVSWSDGYLTQNGYTVPGGDIPEPTSGLLLLVGGAALALRRRQR